MDQEQSLRDLAADWTSPLNVLDESALQSHLAEIAR